MSPYFTLTVYVTRLLLYWLNTVSDVISLMLGSFIIKVVVPADNESIVSVAITVSPSLLTTSTTTFSTASFSLLFILIVKLLSTPAKIPSLHGVVNVLTAISGRITSFSVAVNKITTFL